MLGAKLRTILFVLVVIVGRLVQTAPLDTQGAASIAAPTTLNPADPEFEKILDKFLASYYDKFVSSVGVDEDDESEVGGEEEASSAVVAALLPPHPSSTDNIYDQMMGDQPASASTTTNNDDGAIYIMNFTNTSHNFTHRSNMSDVDYFRTMRNRTKDNWIQALKENILRQIGRANVTTSKPEESRLATLNISAMIPTLLNVSNTLNDDRITEKIRSYYPSCEIPLNTDEDLWKDENIMNLYFNFHHSTDDRGLNIATATLRLYRISYENSTKLGGKIGDCDNNSSVEEDKLLRVSIYWYTKSLKRKRVKRRLSDSKVITEGSRWVELSVKPATRAWVRGRNLGLAILVEDQEGNMLKADRYFKGASCMVGSSTPKPIPTIIIDAARQTNELDRIDGLFGRNSTSPFASDLFMLPSIDICTLEFPENYSHPPVLSHFTNLRINACNLNKLHEHSQYQQEKERLERIAILPTLLQEPTSTNQRHIRHQRQHQHNKINPEFDPRSRIINKRILTQEEFQSLNLDHLNISRVDR